MKQRPTRRAVLVSLELTQDGSIISLDDAVQTDQPEGWKKAEHYTQKQVAGNFLDLPDEELAAFGYHILARLSAFKAGGEL
ncbi:MAG: hypothetical protein ACREB1_09085 [Sphingomicrobium sp.]